MTAPGAGERAPASGTAAGERRPASGTAAGERRPASGTAAGERGPASGTAVVPASVVRLSASDGDPTLFVLHAVGGAVFAYLPLAKELAGSFSLYGVEAEGSKRGSVPATSMASMVERHLEKIRGVQPAGPYRLAGWSMGGILAFEIAHRLEAVGEDVHFVALFDAPFAFPDQPREPGSLAADFVRDAIRGMGVPDREVPEATETGAEEHLDWLNDRLGGGPSLRADLQHRFELYRAHCRILVGYHPVHTLRSDTLLVGASESKALGVNRWPEVLAGTVLSRTLEADHYNLLRPPRVGQVAALVKQFR